MKIEKSLKNKKEKNICKEKEKNICKNICKYLQKYLHSLYQLSKYFRQLLLHVNQTLF